MGSILDVPIDLALYGLAGAGEALGLSGESAAIMAGVLVFVNDVKGLKVSKVINNVDDLLKAATKTVKQPKNKAVTKGGVNPQEEEL